MSSNSRPSPGAATAVASGGRGWCWGSRPRWRLSTIKVATATPRWRSCRPRLPSCSQCGVRVLTVSAAC
eukprot:9642436-Lingulodinium_polyedra.AAC.1